jgi:hypothetical protein
MEVLYQRCCGLDVHKETVTACLRVMSGGEVVREVRTFETTTVSLMALSEWLAENGCTHVAMQATGEQGRCRLPKRDPDIIAPHRHASHSTIYAPR